MMPDQKDPQSLQAGDFCLVSLFYSINAVRDNKRLLIFC